MAMLLGDVNVALLIGPSEYPFTPPASTVVTPFCEIRRMRKLASSGTMKLFVPSIAKNRRNGEGRISACSELMFQMQGGCAIMPA
jgi:hypothetical protein